MKQEEIFKKKEEEKNNKKRMATVTHHLYGNCQMIIALVNKIRKKHLLLK